MALSVYIHISLIEDAMRHDTAAPSILGFGVFVTVSVWGVSRFMLGVPLVDLVRTWQMLADLC